ncbi:MAG: hypothetical protein JRE40_09975, partial [Deltaproteobacteria bacterium]|nr:hypothetical protein [Deltaproteobacteria bacterium]
MSKNDDGNPTTVEYAIKFVKIGGATYYVQADNSVGASKYWKTASAWAFPVNVTDLTGNSNYNVRVIAKNYSGIESDGPDETKSTLANQPTSGSFNTAYTSTHSIRCQWGANDNADGTTYKVNVSTHVNFTVLMGTKTTSSGLYIDYDGLPTANKGYYFQVCALNLEGSPTAPTNLTSAGAQFTAIETPDEITWGTIGETSIQIDFSAETFTNLADGVSGIQFEETGSAGGPWMSQFLKNKLWTRQTGTPDSAPELTANTTYSFRIRTQNQGSPALANDYVGPEIKATKIESVASVDYVVWSSSIGIKGSGSYTNLTKGESGLYYAVCIDTYNFGLSNKSSWTWTTDSGYHWFTKLGDETPLTTGTTYYFITNSRNYEGVFNSTTTVEAKCTLPAAPTSVEASDGTDTGKVVVTWTKSTGATGYRVYRGEVDVSGLLGDVATYDDTGADAPTITQGDSVATDDTHTDKIALSLSGSTTNNGTEHTYKVLAVNSAGNSPFSDPDTGYRVAGSLTYQWQRSAGDSDASYSNIDGGTSASYDDTAAPAPTITPGTGAASDGSSAAHSALSISGHSAGVGAGRYYKCVLNAEGAIEKTATSNRGHRGVGALEYQWQRSAGDSDATYSNIDGGTSVGYNDTAAPVYTVNAPTLVSVEPQSTSELRVTYSGASVTEGAGRYYKCVLNATGADPQTSTSDRGYRNDSIAGTGGYEIFSDTNVGGAYATSEGTDDEAPFDDIELGKNARKYYKVKAKSTDGTWSSLSTSYEGKYTAIETISAIVWGTIGETSIQIDLSAETFTNLQDGDSGIQFEETGSADGPWASNFLKNKIWTRQEGTPASSPVLTANTTYSFRVRTRNQDTPALVNDYVGPDVKATRIESVESVSYFVGSSSIGVKANAVGGSYSNLNKGGSGVYYGICKSSWQFNNLTYSSWTWVQSADMFYFTQCPPGDDLDKDTTYYFITNSRNYDGLCNSTTTVETKWTLAAVPGTPTVKPKPDGGETRIQFTKGDDTNLDYTDYAVAVSSDNFVSMTKFVTTYKVAGDGGEYPVLVDNEQWKQKSSWISDYTIVKGLESNTTYWVKIKARNQAGNETAYSAAAATVTFANKPWNVEIGSHNVMGLDRLGVTCSGDGSEYFVECSTASDYSATKSSSGWLSVSSWTVTGL